MTTILPENPAETLKNIRERAAQLDALEEAIAAERRRMAEVRARLCGVAAPLPDCTDITEGVSLETTGNIEYPFALQVSGTLVEVDDADYCPGDFVNATVTRAFSAAELRTLGQALLTAAERLEARNEEISRIIEDRRDAAYAAYAENCRREVKGGGSA